MVGKRKAKTDCVGGDLCPLGLAKHPQAVDRPAKTSLGPVYPLGCSLCRSERESALKITGQVLKVNKEERKAMLKRFVNFKPKRNLKTSTKVHQKPEPVR